MGKQTPRRIDTIRIVAIYALFGFVWIYGSDTVLGWLIHDKFMIIRIAVVKDSLFVLCTATLLYFLITRFLKQLAVIESGLLVSLKNYQAIFNATNEAIFVHDARNGHILDVNDRMLDIYGYERDEALAADVGQLSEGTFPYSQSEAYEKARKTLIEGPQVFEWLSRKKNGELFWSEVSMRRVSINDFEKIIAVVRDITERKQMHDALRKSEERQRTILQTALSGFWRTDMHGRLIEVNESYCRMSGYSEQELLTMSIPELEANDSADDIAARIQLIVKGGNTRFESRHRCKDGSLFEVEISVQYLPADGGQLVAFLNDITERKQSEEAMRENRAKLEAALNSMTDTVFISDMTGHFVDFNDAFASFHRFGNRTECARKLAEYPHFLEVLMADGKPAPQEMWAVPRALRGETVTNAEYTLRRKDTGETWTGSYSFSPIRDKNERIVGSVVVGRDITDRKQVEAYRSMGRDILLILNGKESLEAAIQQVIGLVKSATGVDAVGIRLQDEDDFPYFYQEGFSKDFLQKENSLLTRTEDGGVCRDNCGNICLECTCGLVVTGTIDPANRLFTSGGSAWTNDSFPLLNTPADEDPRHNARDECIHQGFASVALIPIRAKGSIVGLLQLNDRRKGCFTLEKIETLEDIAENIGEAMLRKQAEEKLIASERFLRTLTDHLPVMVAYWTDEFRCNFANKAYLEWFSKTPEQVMRISLQELLGKELFGKNEPYIRRVLQGEPQHFERALVKSNGAIGYTWAHYIPDLVDSKARGFFVVVSDVTELKQTEEEKVKLEGQLQQAQKMESVGRLAGGVAHDFNNLLTVILGYTHLSSIGLDSAHPLHSNLQEIRKAAERSADLTQQLLAFARKQTIAPKVLDLNVTVENMLKMLRRLIGENIHLSWKPAHKPWLVKVDPSQIDQILANLCVNARDAIADVGKITIETMNTTFNENYCAANFGFVPGEYVLLAVSDDGCGMDKETMTHIFEPFFTTKGVGQGTGLGLATVYGIVKQNNGFINIYSEPGHGTTFKIYLPRQEGTGIRTQIEVSAKPHSSGHETILLVEDESSILKMTTILLEKEGYNVLAANTPGMAIQLAETHADRIHLLLTDVVMPEMNGRDLAKKLLPLCPKIKCLFMSGYTANVIAHHGILDEEVQFISKPFSFPELELKVREILDCPTSSRFKNEGVV